MREASERWYGPQLEFRYAYTKDRDKALRSFIEFELGYGGVITELCQDPKAEEQYVQVTTRIMNKRDVTTYKGTLEELKPFYEIAYLSIAYEEGLRESNFEPIIDALMELTKGVPLMIKMGEGIVRGSHIARVAIAYLLAFEDLDFMQKVIKSGVSLKDLCATHELVCGGASRKDVESLLSL